MGHIFVDLNKPNSTATHTLRLWAALPPAIRWLMHDNTSNIEDIYNGKCIMLINSLASLAEGFLTDLLLSELEKGIHPKKEKLISDLSTSGTWKPKKELFDQLFTKKLSDFKNTEAVETLIALRNNIAHGRTFIEELTYYGENNHSKEIPSRNYASPKEYLIKKGIITDSPGTISPTVFWGLAVIQFYHIHVKKFLFELITDAGAADKDTLQNELLAAYKGDNYPWS